MLEKAVSEWQEASKGRDDLDFFISDIDGEINIGLEFKTAHGPTSIIFNPQATVEELVEMCQKRLERLGLWGNEHLRERLLRIQVKGAIAALLAVVRAHFEDSIWELPLVVSTLYDWKINPPESRRQLFDDLLIQINERKRRRFEVKGRGRRQIIDDELIHVAIRNLDRRPSQRAVAQFLNVTPATIRAWLKKRGFESLDDFIRKSSEEGRK